MSLVIEVFGLGHSKAWSFCHIKPKFHLNCSRYDLGYKRDLKKNFTRCLTGVYKHNSYVIQSTIYLF